MDLQRAMVVAELAHLLTNPDPAQQAAMVLAREVDALQAHIAELQRTATLGGIPPRYTSPTTVTRISRGLL